MRKILSVYGSEVLIKTYCHNCEAYSFVREGKLIGMKRRHKGYNS